MNDNFLLKLRAACSRFLRGFAGRPLLTLILLFFLVLISGAFVFYRYEVLVRLAQPETTGQTIQFEKDLYQQIIKEWQSRDERFEAASVKNYLNPFQQKREKIVFVTVEEPKIISVDPKLLSASNLLEFYSLKGESMPLLNDRAKMWQEFGLGSVRSYIGSNAQNQLLLAELKKGLTE